MKTGDRFFKTGRRLFKQPGSCFKQAEACFCFVTIKQKKFVRISHSAFIEFIYETFNLSVITPRIFCSLIFSIRILLNWKFYFLCFFQDVWNGISLHSPPCNIGKSIDSLYQNCYVNQKWLFPKVKSLLPSA